MKKIIFFAVAIILAALLGLMIFEQAQAPKLENPDPGTAKTKTASDSPSVKKAAPRVVFLYYYNADKDKDGNGNVLCSRHGLAAVSRPLAATKTPIQDTVKLLLEGNLNADEKSINIATEFPLEGLTLAGADLKDGILTLEFNDPNNKTGGGACRAAILWYQIEATALQFDGVKSVKFAPETLFQP